MFYCWYFPACRMGRLKVCPDGSASTAWDYVGLLCNLYSLDWRDRRKQAPNAATILKSFLLTSHKTTFTHGATVADWVATFLRSQHSISPSLKFLYQISFSLLLSPVFFTHLRARELGTVIIIITMIWHHYVETKIKINLFISIYIYTHNFYFLFWTESNFFIAL